MPEHPTWSAFAHVTVDKIGMKLELFDVLFSAFRKQDTVRVWGFFMCVCLFFLLFSRNFKVEIIADASISAHLIWMNN